MELRTEARRLATIATIFIWVGWFTVIYAIVAGIIWWIDLSSKPEFNVIQALGLSLAAIGGPIFLALLVAGLGHFARLFAMYVGTRPG